MVRDGHADILMKGSVVTSKFLQAALGSLGGLKEGLFSDVEVYEDVGSDARLVLVSDGGVNISPGIRQKLEIIRNAVKVAHRLGIRYPRVALLSGSEKVHPDFASTIDAVALVKMCHDGDVEGCVVDGPFALDNAIDMASARVKGIESPVAGSADILIMPNLEAGNIFGKGLQYYAGRMLIHVGMGAKVPILIDSRTAKAQEKLHSIALAKLMCTGILLKGGGIMMKDKNYIIPQISVFIDNRPASLAEMARRLADRNINLRALSLAETREFGTTRIIVADVDACSEVLRQAAITSSRPTFSLLRLRTGREGWRTYSNASRRAHQRGICLCHD